MRTTIILPDELSEQAKSRARAEGRTFTSLVEEALRKLLAEQGSTAEVDLPVFQGSGGALIDLEDRDAVWDILGPGRIG